MGGDHAANMAAVYTKLKNFYSVHKGLVRYSMLKLSMIKNKKDAGPKLRGKAAQVKCLIKPLLQIWSELSDQTDNVHKRILAVLKLNSKIEDTLYMYRDMYTLPEHVHKPFVENVFAMLQIQTGLAHHFACSDDPSLRTVKLFTLTQKAHFLAHISLLSVYINPVRTWCYRGEDFMKVCRALLENCVRGVSQYEVSKKIFEHYRAGLHFNFLKCKPA